MNDSAIAKKSVTWNSATTVSVNNVIDFQNALSSNAVSTINLVGNIGGDIDATRTGATGFTINFGTYVLTGNLTITANSVKNITLNGTAKPAITGDLTIDAANATVTNNISIGGIITVKGVSGDSWIEKADGNRITLTDPNGGAIVIEGNPDDITVEQTAEGIKITVKPGAKAVKITTNSPVEINVEAGAQVDNIEATGTAAGTRITNNGTVTSVESNADIAIENNSAFGIQVSGTGAVGVTGSGSSNVIGDNVVEGLTLVVDTELRIGGVTTATITGATKDDGQTFKVTSAKPTIVSVNSETELGITAIAPGKAAITVQVLEGIVVKKQGTVFVTVYPKLITSAKVIMTAPETGATPQTAAQIEAKTKNLDYTVTSVTWNEELTAKGKFKEETIYTATVVLTSKNNRAFKTEPFKATVAGASSVGDTETIGTGVGNIVVFTVTFPATGPLEPATTKVKLSVTSGNTECSLTVVVITK